MWIQKNMQQKVENNRTFAIATEERTSGRGRVEREPTVLVKSASQKLNIDSSFGA